MYISSAFKKFSNFEIKQLCSTHHIQFNKFKIDLEYLNALLTMIKSNLNILFS